MKLSKETIEKLDEIQSRFNEESTKVLIEQAKETYPYQVGDILEDHCQIGRVEKISFSVSVTYRRYGVQYTCERLKKNLEPFKSGERIVIYSQNINRKIEE